MAEPFEQMIPVTAAHLDANGHVDHVDEVRSAFTILPPDREPAP